MSTGQTSILKIFALIVGVSVVTSAAEVSIQWEPKNDPNARFLVKGLPSKSLENMSESKSQARGLSNVVRVFTVTNGKAAETPMSGDVEVGREAIAFTPRYPLRPGMTYRVVFDPSHIDAAGLGNIARQEQDFAMPRSPSSEAAEVTSIFPSGDVLPENLLRLYIYFSQPMSRGEAYQRIHLLDEKGKEVQFPFLELAEELWSPDGKRFSLYFDPGRIKRGLQPRELFGPALVEGGAYSLIVDAAWTDANGEPLQKTFTKRFRVVAPDDTRPDPKRWKIHAPSAGTRDPVVMDLDESLDSGMLQRVLEIRDPAGKVVAGEIRLTNHEQRWEFTPVAKWASGRHRLIVSTAIEDLAGNSIRRLFEIDVLRPADPEIESQVAELFIDVK